MFDILKKTVITDNVIEYVLSAPKIAAKALPGQFILLRVDEEGERVPFTISDYDREKGTITLLIQTVGATTMQLAKMNEGDCLHDIVGPLGKATHLDADKILLVAGGIGVAVQGSFEEGDCTIFKCEGDLSRWHAQEGHIIDTPFNNMLCRTQIKVCLDDFSYFLTKPINNHHIICRGKHAAEIEAFFKLL